MVFRFAPEEFIVEEILSDGAVLETDKPFKLKDEPGKFAHFVLQKRKWNTMQALTALARELRTSRKRFNFAGTKDRNSISTQLCSVFGMMPAEVEKAHVKDLTILGAWNAADKVRLGDLAGNRFTITLTEENCGKAASAGELEEKAAALGGSIPNFFGEQRFGSLRKNTHLVGKLIIQGKLKEAVMNYLAFVDEGEDEEARKAREELGKEKDFAKALSYYPLYLKYERSMIAHLNAYQKDYAGALRKLPRTLQLMFIHAYQSWLFNQLLEQRIAKEKLFEAAKGDWWCKADKLGFPKAAEAEEITSAKKAEEVTASAAKGKAFLLGHLVGYETELTPKEKALLKKEGIAPKDFKLATLPELSSKGSMRPLFVRLAGFEILEKEPIKIRFSLPAGAYATVALRELLK